MVQAAGEVLPVTRFVVVRPSAHGVQAAMPAVGAYVPAGQAVQAELFASDEVPAGH